LVLQLSGLQELPPEPLLLYSNLSYQNFDLMPPDFPNAMWKQLKTSRSPRQKQQEQRGKRRGKGRSADRNVWTSPTTVPTHATRRGPAQWTGPRSIHAVKL
jgi:hypothetical protein